MICCSQVGKLGRTHSSSRGHQRFVEIVQAYQTDFFICGVAPWNGNLVLLAHLHGTASNPSTEDPERPEIRVLTRLDDSRFEIDSYDVLSLHGWQLHTPSDFLLAHLPEFSVEDGKRMRSEPLFFVACPNDIVLGKPRDSDDHVAWLLERSRCEEAL